MEFLTCALRAQVRITLNYMGNINERIKRRESNK